MASLTPQGDGVTPTAGMCPGSIFLTVPTALLGIGCKISVIPAQRQGCLDEHRAWCRCTHRSAAQRWMECGRWRRAAPINQSINYI